MLYYPTLISIIVVLLVTIPVLLTVAYVTVAERKTMASMQRRLGPNIVGYYGLLQAFADALKLLLTSPPKANPFGCLPLQSSFDIFVKLIKPHVLEIGLVVCCLFISSLVKIWLAGGLKGLLMLPTILDASLFAVLGNFLYVIRRSLIDLSQKYNASNVFSILLDKWSEFRVIFRDNYFKWSNFTFCGLFLTIWVTKIGHFPSGMSEIWEFFYLDLNYKADGWRCLSSLVLCIIGFQLRSIQIIKQQDKINTKKK